MRVDLMGAAQASHEVDAPGDLRRYRAILLACGYTEVLIAATSLEEARVLAEQAKYELPYELVEHAVEDVFEDQGLETADALSLAEQGPQLAFEFFATAPGQWPAGCGAEAGETE